MKTFQLRYRKVARPMPTKEEVDALEAIRERWTGDEPMTALRDDAIALYESLPRRHRLLREIDAFIVDANRCIRFGPG